MQGILEQLKQLKADQMQLKVEKEKEQRKINQFITNCKKLIHIQSQERQDFVLENLIQLEESFKNIAINIAGFKSIRNRLFTAANAEGENKLFLYVFHLFESVIADVSQLCAKSGDFAFSSLSQNTVQAAKRKIRKKRGTKKGEEGVVKKKTPGTSANVSFTGDHTDKSANVTVSSEDDGFFNENIKSIMESKCTINNVI
jgi:hypothetical protein